ncbi:MAG: hypothetical protein ACXABE_12795 [Candidatus Thorarchaeota archaeon]|jgi:hypothetical protein
MRSKKLVLLSLLIVLVTGVNSDAPYQDLPLSLSQEILNEPDLVKLDNVTIEEDPLLHSTCLSVGFSWFGGSEESQLWPFVMLALSMDNSSWLRLESHSFDRYENTSHFFRIYNSILQPFPFDVDPGDTLYVSLLFDAGLGLSIGPILYARQTPGVGIVVESGITRYWHFTIDWRVPGIIGFVISWLFAVFLIARLPDSHKATLENIVDEDTKY